MQRHDIIQIPPDEKRVLGRVGLSTENTGACGNPGNNVQQRASNITTELDHPAPAGQPSSGFRLTLYHVQQEPLTRRCEAGALFNNICILRVVMSLFDPFSDVFLAFAYLSILSKTCILV